MRMCQKKSKCKQQYQWTMKVCAVIGSKLLIKDHKKKKPNGDYPTRLLVPAGNFTAAFDHLGWKAIEKLLIKNKVNYQSENIKNAYDLKRMIEETDIRESTHTLYSMDIVKMYPSVKFRQIEKAVEYFLRNASEEDKKQANLCLDLVRFSMANTFITFQDKCWLYGGDKQVAVKGLTIGGFGSAGFADLVAAFIMEKSSLLFQKLIIKKIY